MIALILTGGRSRRMGRDKLLIERPDGMRQIDWLAKLVREAGLKAMLSRRDDSPAPVDLPTVIDRRAEGGPLAALEAFHELHPGQPVLLLGGDLFLMAARMSVQQSHRDARQRLQPFALLGIERARLPVDHAQRSDRLPIASDQRHARVEARTHLADHGGKRGEARIAR